MAVDRQEESLSSLPQHRHRWIRLWKKAARLR